MARGTEERQGGAARIERKSVGEAVLAERPSELIENPPELKMS
jgi:hypothetical protein